MDRTGSSLLSSEQHSLLSISSSLFPHAHWELTGADTAVAEAFGRTSGHRTVNQFYNL